MLNCLQPCVVVYVKLVVFCVCLKSERDCVEQTIDVGFVVEGRVEVVEQVET